jgi:Zn-dependent protease with chaperone function
MSALSLPLVLLAIGTATGWLCAVTLLPLWTRWATERPELARWALVVAAVPWLVGGAVALGAVLPLDPHQGAFGCHCAPGGVHLCPMHPQSATALVLPAVGVLLLLLPGRLHGLYTLLREPMGQGLGGTPSLVPLPTPRAFLVGWLYPSLVVDPRLWHALDPVARRALLAHEEAHLRRRDPSTLWTVRLLGALGPQPVANALARVWLERAEHRADAIAAHAVGSPMIVAETLVRCARLGATPDLAVSWTGGRVERRVRALLDNPPPVASSAPDAGLPDLLGVAVLSLVALCCSPWVHHQFEHLFFLSL